MGPFRALFRLLNRSLEWLFGGAEGHRQAFDMMDRLKRAFPAALTIIALGFLPGLVHYNAIAAVPLIGAGVCYYLALTVPAKARYPELVAALIWLCGLVLSVVAAGLAGPPYAFLWTGAAISLPFIAVIWPSRVVVASVAVLALGMVIFAFTWVGDRAYPEPPSLVGPLIGLVMTVAMLTAVREIDRRNRQAVLTDVLTGLGNRAALDVFVRDLLTDPSVAGTPLAMAVFDLDHFKLLNDKHGHAAGDAALKATAAALETGIPEGAGVFRYGGEEFVVLLPATDQAAALQIADGLRLRIGEIELAGERLSISGGVVVDRLRSGLDLPALFQRADAALYDAKAQGRNRVLVGLPEVRAARAPRIVAVSGRGTKRGGLSKRSFRLVRTRLERDHLRSMWLALRGPGMRRGSHVALIVATLAGSYWLGWWPVAIAVLAAIVLDPRVAGRRSLPVGVRGNEYGLLVESVFGMVCVGAAVYLSKIEALYLLPLVAIPAVPSIVAYRSLGSMVAGVIGALVILAAGLLAAPDVVIANPIAVSLPIGFVGTVTVVGMALVSSTMEHAAAANVDPLTGALNRGALEARVAEFAGADASSYEPVTLIVADLDHFKAINDTYGHDVGDEVLVDVARRLQQELRLVDVLYRIGGEEFVVLLPRTATPEARQIAERLRESISARPCGGRPLTVSLGLASSDQPGFEYSPAFDRADAALLEAKEHGRNRVVVSNT